MIHISTMYTNKPQWSGPVYSVLPLARHCMQPKLSISALDNIIRHRSRTDA